MAYLLWAGMLLRGSEMSDDEEDAEDGVEAVSGTAESGKDGRSGEFVRDALSTASVCLPLLLV